MSAWHYLKTAFWQRVPLPLMGRVPVNAAAFAGFGIAGFDNPAFWAAGAAWQTLWLTATAGRVSYRQKIDAAHRRTAWRTLEERRLQLYNQLPDADRLRHHQLRQTCQVLLSPAPGTSPDPSAELFTWLHLKLLLVRYQALNGRIPAGDPDVALLHAGAVVELTDPARAYLAEEAISLIDPRQSTIRDPSLPLVPRLDAALARLEAALTEAVRQKHSATTPRPATSLEAQFAGDVKHGNHDIPAMPAAAVDEASSTHRVTE